MVNLRCYVCDRHPSTDPKITLHSFPKYPDSSVFKKWISALGLHEETQYEEVKYLQVCSRHFLGTDYLGAFRSANKPRKLYSWAVPSIGVPNPVYEKKDASESNGSIGQDSRSSEDNMLNCEENTFLHKLHNECDSKVEDAIFEDDGKYKREETECFLKDKEESYQETECFLKDKEESYQEQEVSELPRSDRLLSLDSLYLQEKVANDGDFPRYSFTVPRYFLDKMTTKLRRTRMEMRTVKHTLLNQMMKAEILKKTNKKFLQKIMILRKKLHKIEFQQSLRACKEIERSSNIDNLSYNLKKAERDFSALVDMCMMPRCWSFVAIRAGLLFLFHNDIGPSVWPVERCVLLLPDMTLSIRILDRPVPDLIPGEMKTMVGVLSALKKVESAKPCRGFYGDCYGKGIVPDREQIECDDCRDERRRFKEDVILNRLDFFKAARKCKKMKQQLCTLKGKLRRLKERVKKEENTIRLKPEVSSPTITAEVVDNRGHNLSMVRKGVIVFPSRKHSE